MDQAYFALGGLFRYGFVEQANTMLAALLANGEGLQTGTSPLGEYYQPLTGARLGAPHFGWTAAHVLLMLHQDFFLD
jgi:putative isomerase